MTSFSHLATLKPQASLVTALVVALLVTSLSRLALGVDPLKDGKKVFLSLMASRCSVKCNSNKIRPVCGTDDVTYASRCELKRAKKCDGLRIKVKHKGRCAGDSKCEAERHEQIESARLKGEKQQDVFVPKCKPDGSYNEIQCHSSTGYCWCVTSSGKHLPSTSVKGQRPSCGRGRKRRRKGKGGKSKKKKSCSNRDRQAFNTALVKVFEEEYLRSHPNGPAEGAADADEFGTEKAIVLWKFDQLDKDKDGVLKFKEIRNFRKMLKKLIPPRACAKRFTRYCDKQDDHKIEKDEWTLCIGVDIKPDGGGDGRGRGAGPGSAGYAGRPAGTLETLDRIAEGLRLQNNPEPFSALSPSGSSSISRSNQDSKNDKRALSCVEERDVALKTHAHEPDAKHFIPACTATGLWEKAQCHKARGYCWCAQEKTGIPIPGTATYKVTPNCSFENDRELEGCPFEEKRKFLVDLLGDLSKERQQAMSAISNDRSAEEDDLSLRETVARWKLKSLDVNGNGVLDRKEWRALRKGSLKNKKYPRTCRRNFVRYCDEDNSKKITFDEWKSCLGLNENNFNSLPMNPKRKGKKNPFMDQLT